MKSQKPTREIAIAIHKEYLKDCDADVIDYMEECVKQGQLSQKEKDIRIVRLIPAIRFVNGKRLVDKDKIIEQIQGGKTE